MMCGCRTHGFDQRGWGRSVQTLSQRGLTGPTTTVLNDISSVVASLLPKAASMSVPIFMMGHSMGGAEVIQWAARGPSDMRSQIRGYVAESPYLALHVGSLLSILSCLVLKMSNKTCFGGKETFPLSDLIPTSFSAPIK